MTEIWRYMVRSYEHHFPVRESYREPLEWFWRLCWWLADNGVIVVTEGNYWRDAEWRWRFWSPVTLRWPGGEITLSWRDYKRSRSCWK